MAENSIAIGLILCISPVFVVALDDYFDDYESGSAIMLFVQAIIGIVLIIFGVGAMLGGE